MTVFDLDGTGSSHVDFDLLMVATGAKPADGGIEGMELEGDLLAAVLEDAERLRHAVGSGEVKRAVVVGAGYIGLEMAEVLQRLDIAVTVVTSAWVMEKTLDADIGELIAEKMRSMGIEVITDTKVEHMTGRNGHVAEVGCDRPELPADLVVVGLGTRPDVELAEAAGIPLGPTGAIAVDDRQRTGIDGVWAGGDCGEAKHRVSGRPVNIHLGTVANKQGRGGRDQHRRGRHAVPRRARHGDNQGERSRDSPHRADRAPGADAGLDATSATAEGTTTAGYWPDAAEMSIKVVVERGSGRLLGAQIVGAPGAGKRVDVFATALWNGMAADDLAWTDLAYAPPFSGVWDLIPSMRAGGRRWLTSVRGPHRHHAGCAPSRCRVVRGGTGSATGVSTTLTAAEVIEVFDGDSFLATSTVRRRRCGSSGSTPRSGVSVWPTTLARHWSS